MGTYLTDDQIERIREALSIVYSLPYAADLVGTAWEQIFADIKGGIWTQKRDKRAQPDFYVQQGDQRINYAVKTEALPRQAQYVVPRSM